MGREPTKVAAMADATPATTRWSIESIGVVHSPYDGRRGTPVQPAYAGRDAVGTIEVYPPFAEGLSDIEGFERIWVISWLDRSGPVRMRVMPHLDDRERGLFATRSPNRPNPIGISALRLLQRRGPILDVADLDLLDGTPVLDLKPYARRIDFFAGTRDGWIADAHRRRSADGRSAPDD